MSVEIIAEVAQGFEGNPTLALLLARGAVRAGADAVKFQLVYADELATPDYMYYDLFRGLEMKPEAWQDVVDEIKEGGVRLYFDVFGEGSLREAISMGADGVKIHTTEFFNTKLVRQVLDVMPRVYVSLGGISADELEEFIDFHGISQSQQVFFVYGYQAEPTPLASNNLRRLASLKKRFPDYNFGFMDHADGGSDDAMDLSLVALPFGIKCIEKHISLDRVLQLEDYVSALSPNKFEDFVYKIKYYEDALGSDDLELTELEKEYRHKAMKTVVAVSDLKKGTVINSDDLSLKRVAFTNPSSFVRIEEVVDQTLVVDVHQNQQITEEMLL